jgi:L-ascorbate metabolism protein UlaG (beta-lactamase superfamily)
VPWIEHDGEADDMQLTAMGHSCVRLSDGGRTLVIDPGAFSERNAIDGAEAILITHEHPDHFDVDLIRAAVAADTSLEIWTNETIAATLADMGSRVHPVNDGSSFAAAGFDVSVHGEWHATIHPDLPAVRNVCFLVGGEAFHPGDSFTRPSAGASTVLIPVYAPWMKLSEAVQLARDLRPERLVAIHDGMLNERGTGLVDRLLGSPLVGVDGSTPTYHHLAAGASIEL